MAIASPVSAQPLSSLTGTRQEANSVPLGVRGAISLGSGLRAGVVLAENVDRIASELQEARAAAAEATLEAQRTEAELRQAQAETDRQEASTDTETAAATVNASETALDEDAAAGQIAAAQQAGANGAETARGTFIDFAV